MEHWLSKVLKLLQVETKDLRELAKIAGGNPKTFYRGARLGNVDLTGQDLRGMEFTDLQAPNLIVDENTKLDRRYAKSLKVKKPQTPTTHVEQTDLHDVAWADKWLTKSVRASSNAHRESINSEGETLLRLHPATDENWPRIWHRIWLHERRKSARRERLHQLALEKISASPNESAWWLIVFRRLWKNVGPAEREILDTYFRRELLRFAARDPSDDQWFRHWTEFSQASKTSGMEAASLFKIGFSWLQQRSINDPKWSTMWRHLWSLDSSQRPLLRPLALTWLRNVDNRAVTSGWSAVWRRLWRSGQRAGEIKEDLLRMAEWWLHDQVHSHGWLALWRDVLKHYYERVPAWVTTAGVRWLELHTKSADWPLVWQQLRERVPPTERQLLMKAAREWFQEQTAAHDWPPVWLEEWNLKQLQKDPDLRRQAEEWLATQPKSVLRSTISKIISNLDEADAS